MAIATSTAIALAVAGAKAGTAVYQAKKAGDAAKKAAQLSPAGELALVWEDSHVLLGADLAAFLDAVDALAGLSRQLYTPRPGSRARKTLYVFLVGEGAGYP